MHNAADIARFLIEEHKPALGEGIVAMFDEAVGASIIEAVFGRFPDRAPDDLMQALLLAQEIERVDLGEKRRGMA